MLENPKASQHSRYYGSKSLLSKAVFVGQVAFEKELWPNNVLSQGVPVLAPTLLSSENSDGRPVAYTTESNIQVSVGKRAFSQINDTSRKRRTL